MGDLIERAEVLEVINDYYMNPEHTKILVHQINNLTGQSSPTIPIQAVLNKIEQYSCGICNQKIECLKGEKYICGVDKTKSWLQEQQALQAKNEFAHRQLRKKVSQVTDIRQMI